MRERDRELVAGTVFVCILATLLIYGLVCLTPSVKDSWKKHVVITSVKVQSGDTLWAIWKRETQGHVPWQCWYRKTSEMNSLGKYLHDGETLTVWEYRGEN